MIILGLILLVAGWLLGFGILTTLGAILLIIGLVFLLLGFAGHPIGGRSNWY